MVRIDFSGTIPVPQDTDDPEFRKAITTLKSSTYGLYKTRQGTLVLHKKGSILTRPIRWLQSCTWKSASGKEYAQAIQLVAEVYAKTTNVTPKQIAEEMRLMSNLQQELCRKYPNEKQQLLNQLDAKAKKLLNVPTLMKKIETITDEVKKSPENFMQILVEKLPTLAPEAALAQDMLGKTGKEVGEKFHNQVMKTIGNATQPSVAKLPCIPRRASAHAPDTLQDTQNPGIKEWQTAIPEPGFDALVKTLGRESNARIEGLGTQTLITGTDTGADVARTVMRCNALYAQATEAFPNADRTEIMQMVAQALAMLPIDKCYRSILCTEVTDLYFSTNAESSLQVSRSEVQPDLLCSFQFINVSGKKVCHVTAGANFDMININKTEKEIHKKFNVTEQFDIPLSPNQDITGEVTFYPSNLT